MYDKIKELAEQSHMAWAMQTDVNRKCVQEFAESIIKECCTVIDNYGYRVGDTWDDRSEYLGMQIRGTVHEITNHFGIGQSTKIDDFTMNISDPISKMYENMNLFRVKS